VKLGSAGVSSGEHDEIVKATTAKIANAKNLNFFIEI
jgi:hypothetical protein